MLLIATSALTASTGAGIEESLPGGPVSVTAEVAAITVPDSGTGTPVRDSSAGTQKRRNQDVATKKRVFLKQVLPHIEQENEVIARDRLRLIALAGKVPIGTEDRAFVKGLARSYRISTSRSDAALIESLLRRVDRIPPSLVLAQAAIESAWGTSRFARDANNLFGQWCMTEGCGIVPAARDVAATHEVKRFDSIRDSVHGYFMNINTNRAYRPLWDLRSCQRDRGQTLSGQALADGLRDYAQTGEAYVESVRRMIRVNRWDALDKSHPLLAQVRYGAPGCDAGTASGEPQGTMIAAGE